MAVRGTSEIVFGTHQTTFWDHIGRLLGGGRGQEGGSYDSFIKDHHSKSAEKLSKGDNKTQLERK